MEENKKILLSGRLSGTRTFTSELEQLDNPDDIEKFLLYFSKLNIDMDELHCTNFKYINDDQELLEINSQILASEYISIYPTENFSRLYITLDTRETFAIRLSKISPAIIGAFISKEKPIKFSINSFNFIKWCTSKSIEIKNLLDIPTYIKLLTNDVDPFKTAENYLMQYTNYVIDNNDNEKNNMMLSNFIYVFGRLLAKYIEDFDLDTVSRLINENSYYEGNTFNNTGNCIINIQYTNVESAISNITPEIVDKFKDKSYIISPLNRIAPKFKQDVSNLIYETYAEDLSITILNELYNNNIPVKLNYETNTYAVTCKFKNFTNIVTILNAIFSEAFLTLFDQTPEMYMECIIKD